MSDLPTFSDLVKGGYWQAWISDCQPPRSRRESPIKNARSIRLSGPHRTEADAVKAAQAQIDSGWANGSIIVHRESAKPSASFVLANETINALGRLRDILGSAALDAKEREE